MKMKHITRISFITAGLLLAVTPLSVRAGEYTWTNHAPAFSQLTAEWNNPGNWQEAGFPNSTGDTARFVFQNDTGSLHLELGEHITVGSISMVDTSNNSMYLEGSDTLTFDNGNSVSTWERRRDVSSGNALRMEVSCHLHLSSDLAAIWQVQRRLPLTGVISGPGRLTINYRQQASDANLIEFGGSAPNTYTGGTVLNGDSGTAINETFSAAKNGAFGAGDVQLNAWAVLQLADQGATDDMIADTATVLLGKDGSASSTIRLEAGVNETIDRLVLAGVEQFPGTYGAGGSGAQVIKDEYFSGPGILTVLNGPPGPGGISTGIGVTGITPTGAVLNGGILATNASPTSVYVYWGVADGGLSRTGWEHEATLGTRGPGAISVTVSGEPLQTYYYRCYLTNDLGELWTSPAVAFKLHGPPEIEHDRVILQTDGVILRGTVQGTNGYPAAAWFYWGSVDGGTDHGAWHNAIAAGSVTNGPLARRITNLTANADYYWRLFASNGYGVSWAESTASFTAPGPPATNDITFFCISDMHYGLNPEITAFGPGMVDRMNELPGASWPASLGGGVVQPPRGIVIPGDTTERDTEDEWALFINDYGLLGEARLAYPVYEGYGNHDGSTYVVERMKARTLQRPCVSRISENGMHYSWDWDYLHLIHLNVSPGLTYHPYDPRFSFTFLTNDLAAAVGDSERPVIIFHHFGYESSSLGWWPAQDRTNFFNAIAPYNVVAVVHGHSHDTGFYTREGVTICNTPHVEKYVEGIPDHGFLAFHIVSNQMSVAIRTSDDTWGATLKTDISIPEPAAGMAFAVALPIIIHYTRTRVCAR